jgi:hypothetical protein
VMPGLAGLARSAIDQASVFRFIEKPFDPVAVRLALCGAVDDLERERRNRRNVERVRVRPGMAPAESFA